MQYVFILCRHRRLKRRGARDGRRIFRSYRYPARGFHHRTRSFICSFSTISWKQERRNERRRDERRENDEKWTVTRIPFNRPDTYIHARAGESVDENRHVSFLALFPAVVLPPLLSAVLRSLLLLHPDTPVKTFTVAADPSNRA